MSARTLASFAATALPAKAANLAKPTKPAKAADLSRFAHFAAVPLALPDNSEPAAALTALRRPLSRAEMAAELASHPGFASARQAADFALTAAGIAPKAASRASAVKSNLNTAEGLAKFVVDTARRTGALR